MSLYADCRLDRRKLHQHGMPNCLQRTLYLFVLPLAPNSKRINIRSPNNSVSGGVLGASGMWSCVHTVHLHIFCMSRLHGRSEVLRTSRCSGAFVVDHPRVFPVGLRQEFSHAAQEFGVRQVEEAGVNPGQ